MLLGGASRYGSVSKKANLLKKFSFQMECYWDCYKFLACNAFCWINSECTMYRDRKEPYGKKNLLFLVYVFGVLCVMPDQYESNWCVVGLN